MSREPLETRTYRDVRGAYHAGQIEISDRVTSELVCVRAKEVQGFEKWRCDRGRQIEELLGCWRCSRPSICRRPLAPYRSK